MGVGIFNPFHALLDIGLTVPNLLTLTIYFTWNYYTPRLLNINRLHYALLQLLTLLHFLFADGFQVAPHLLYELLSHLLADKKALQQHSDASSSLNTYDELRPHLKNIGSNCQQRQWRGKKDDSIDKAACHCDTQPLGASISAIDNDEGTKDGKVVADVAVNIQTFCEQGSAHLQSLNKTEQWPRDVKCSNILSNNSVKLSNDFNEQNYTRNIEHAYECTVCNQTYFHLHKLKEHEKTHCSERSYDCTVCDKSFLSSFNLKKHKEIHNKVQKFVCTVCKKTFSKSCRLKNHERMHSGVRPYICTVCCKSFATLSNLRGHEKIHRGERPFECTICRKTFARTHTLKCHERIHSGERPYACPFCSKTFRQRSTLKCHERVHNGERPYACTICNKTFTQASSLKSHERIHSGERPYACASCNKTFADLSTLKHHGKVHRPKRQCQWNICNEAFLMYTISESEISQIQLHACTICSMRLYYFFTWNRKNERVHRGESNKMNSLEGYEMM